jgi:hypothetical protein
MRRLVRWVVAAAVGLVPLSAAWAGPAYPKAFYAEFDLASAGAKQALRKVRVYATPQLVRLERAAGEAVLIYDVRSDRTRVLFPLRREYVEVAGPSEVGPFLPVESADACPARGPVAARCRRLGTETVAGRPAVKWEVGLQTLWVDRELRVVLRRQVRGVDTMVARTVRVGPQPAGLFEVPRGYRKTG